MDSNNDQTFTEIYETVDELDEDNMDSEMSNFLIKCDACDIIFESIDSYHAHNCLNSVDILDENDELSQQKSVKLVLNENYNYVIKEEIIEPEDPLYNGDVDMENVSVEIIQTNNAVEHGKKAETLLNEVVKKGRKALTKIDHNYSYSGDKNDLRSQLEYLREKLLKKDAHTKELRKELNAKNRKIKNLTKQLLDLKAKIKEEESQQTKAAILATLQQTEPLGMYDFKKYTMSLPKTRFLLEVSRYHI